MAYKNKFEEACKNCGKPTNEACDECEKPCCHGCLFKTGETLTLESDPRNEDYAEHPTWQRREELCMTCYQTKLGRAPLVLWEGSSAQTMLVIMPQMKPGASIPAGDYHSWHRSPSAGDVLLLNWSPQQHIELDAFRTVQLLDWLKANEAAIREQAKAASDILVPYERKMTDRAIRADLGITDDYEADE